MKIKTLLALSLIAGGFQACRKDLPAYLAVENYTFTGYDEDGGAWKTVLTGSGAAIEVSIPEAANTPGYQAELSELKTAMSQVTSQQRERIAYWTHNPVIRWNEIALELIAKYNLVPGPNDDGSYTLPNPASPEGPPSFPFAHPPYAVRALAYLSVAQFDGLITAWHYKYTYNRPSPYQADASIKYAYTTNDIPSYPSDGAVIAAASRAILSAMFPLEKSYLEQLEADHLESLWLSGGNVKSDLDAGKSIGQEIAIIALARAANDGMKNAQAPKPVSDSIKAAAFTRFGRQWDNLELPVRPVGLVPLFGKVKLWNLPDVAITRPEPPPALDSPELQKDIAILKDYAKNVTTETRRIANFWQDGAGTYTPPGHWNRIAKEYLVRDRLNPLRSARVFAYLNMAMMDGGISCWDAKYYYHYPRPIQVIPGFKTIAGTPNFPSYTSGHSVFSAAGAEVLAYIFPKDAAQFRAWAGEAAISRVYGGIHWTFDATAGTKQGEDVAQFTIAAAEKDGAD